jgi:hypothetical protein
MLLGLALPPERRTTPTEVRVVELRAYIYHWQMRD